VPAGADRVREGEIVEDDLWVREGVQGLLVSELALLAVDAEAAP
jgi:hypothetical protein